MWPASSQHGIALLPGPSRGWSGQKGNKNKFSCQAGLKECLSWCGLPGVTCPALPTSLLLARFVKHSLAVQA